MRWNDMRVMPRIPESAPGMVSAAEHKHLLDEFEKLQEKHDELMKTEKGELQTEIQELHRQLGESEKGEREAQEYGERITEEFKLYMTETNREITKLTDMNTNLTKQRDHLLSGYHAEVMS